MYKNSTDTIQRIFRNSTDTRVLYEDFMVYSILCLFGPIRILYEVSTVTAKNIFNFSQSLRRVSLVHLSHRLFETEHVLKKHASGTMKIKKNLEMRGIEPRAYRMRSDRSTPELHPLSYTSSLNNNDFIFCIEHGS